VGFGGAVGPACSVLPDIMSAMQQVLVPLISIAPV